MASKRSEKGRRNPKEKRGGGEVSGSRRMSREERERIQRELAAKASHSPPSDPSSAPESGTNRESF